jgi:hypothetical protein
LDEASGDQQARAELLGKLLIAAGEKPYLLKHGEERAAYYLMLVPVKDDEAAEWTKTAGSAPVLIAFGPLKMTPLPLEKDQKAGSIEKRFYDPATAAWTATTAVMRFK